MQSNFNIFQALSAFTGIVAGFTIAVILIALSGTVLLWMYGSFWTTSIIALCGGNSLIILQLWLVYCISF